MVFFSALSEPMGLPKVASSPITDSLPWVRTTEAPSPTVTSVSVVSGPISQRSPMLVAPSSWVPGRMTVSPPPEHCPDGEFEFQLSPSALRLFGEED